MNPGGISKMFRFSGFSLTGKIQYGVESEIFSAVGYKWYVCFYPNGNTTYYPDLGYVSIYLKLASHKCLVQISCSFLLVDPSGANPPCPLKGPDTAILNTLDRLNTKADCGYSQLIRRKKLEEHPYFKDDSFTIECRINILKDFCIHVSDNTPIKTAKDINIVPPLDLQKDLVSLLESGLAADVSFKVSTKTFNAHRCILAARSPVFRAQLCGPLKESTEESIIIHEMEAPVFKAMLSFMYSDFQSCPEIDDSVPMAQHLLVAADRYELERLRMICEDRLIESINVANVATTLVLAEQHGCMQLKAACLEFMASPCMADAILQLRDSNTCV